MSLQKQIHSFWSYKQESSAVMSVQLFLWAKGMCVTGHDESGALVAGSAYAYDQVYELRVLENLILNEPLLADADLVRNICMCVSRNIIIPQALMPAESGIMDHWLQKIHYVEYDEDICSSHLNEIGVDIIYPKKKVVREILGQYFPKRTSKFYIAPPVLLEEAYADYVFILMLDDQCSLTFYKNRTFVHHHIPDWTSVEDIFIQAHHQAGRLGISSESLQWRLGGISSQIDDMSRELSAYIPGTQYKAVSPEDMFKAFSICG